MKTTIDLRLFPVIAIAVFSDQNSKARNFTILNSHEKIAREPLGTARKPRKNCPRIIWTQPANRSRPTRNQPAIHLDEVSKLWENIPQTTRTQPTIHLDTAHDPSGQSYGVTRKLPAKQANTSESHAKKAMDIINKEMHG